MTRWVRLFLVSGATMIIMDAVWLTLAVDRLYRPNIGHLMRDDGFLVSAAIAFYVLYLFGVLVLAQLPAGHWFGAARRGAVFGLCAYGTYDLTNQATLRDWPWLVTSVDLAWGTVLTAVVAATGHALEARWSSRQAT
jgi:uncharacterized membrane protein